MKKNLKLFGSAIALCFAVIACEKNDQGLLTSVFGLLTLEAIPPVSNISTGQRFNQEFFTSFDI